jgi:PadR family transcriptional regulator, regulatory protein PadR
MRAEILKGHLDLLLLAAVQARPAHGYAVIDEVRRRSDGAFDLPEGTVYPALHRLERGGLLASSWSDASGRRRRIYSLTERGNAALAEQRQGWATFSHAVGAVVSAGSP